MRNKWAICIHERVSKHKIYVVFLASGGCHRGSAPGPRWGYRPPDPLNFACGQLNPRTHEKIPIVVIVYDCSICPLVYSPGWESSASTCLVSLELKMQCKIRPLSIISISISVFVDSLTFSITECFLNTVLLNTVHCTVNLLRWLGDAK